MTEITSEKNQENSSGAADKRAANNNPIKNRFTYKSVRRLLLVLSVAAMLLTLVVGLVLLNKQQFETLALSLLEQEQAISSLEVRAAKLDSDTENTSELLKSNLTELEKNTKLLLDALKNSNAKIQTLEQQNLAISRRLRSISTTSREDWLLAEAEYLLKLANQRILLEKSANGALALVQEADKILQGLAEPDLFSVREAVAKDLIALKLAKDIDLEGLYLKISALKGEVKQLPTMPELTPRDIDDNEESEKKNRFIASFHAFLQNLKKLVRYTNHDEEHAPVISPEYTLYVQQNFNLILEKMQIALVRQNASLYRLSSQEALNWLNEHFPISPERSAFATTIEALSSTPISADLPDISVSLETLKDYIERLHALQTQARTEAISE